MKRKLDVGGAGASAAVQDMSESLTGAFAARSLRRRREEEGEGQGRGSLRGLKGLKELKELKGLRGLRGLKELREFVSAFLHPHLYKETL